jgi:hypothetical protein
MKRNESNAQMVLRIPLSQRRRFIRNLKMDDPREYEVMKQEMAEMKKAARRGHP